MTSEEPSLTILERLLLAQLTEAMGADASDNEIAEWVTRLFEEVEPELVASTIASYREAATTSLGRARADREAFEARSFDRWRTAFDHLETLWHVATELGEMNGLELQASGEVDGDLVMTALANLFPKALLITGEIICLLRDGYPDGALARWRSLHEVTVTAMYIRKNGHAVAMGYLASFHFAARRAAHQLVEHADRSGIEPPAGEELAALDARCKAAKKLLGRAIARDKDGEWPAINPVHRDFAAIERDVGMDHWRPRYKWASTYTHAGHRPHTNVLGMVEARAPAQLVGPSNSGFVDPLQMTAITLGQATVTYLLHRPNPDRVVHAKVILRLVDDMVNLPQGGERPTDGREPLPGASTT